MCALSIQFCYQAGLFNIGAAGQYVAGAGAALYCALALNLPWPICLIAAFLAGGVFGVIVGLLKSYLNVNEVISGIMLNWIGLYLTNIVLKSSQAFDQSKNETFRVASINPSAIIPDLGLQGANAFGPNSYVTLAIIIVPIICILIFLFLRHSTFGYELKATGSNKDAARYAGMKEKRNIIITMAIGGAIAAMAAPFYYLTNIEQYFYPTSVPSMGFNGISSAFLGGLDPIGVIFSSYFLTHITEGGARIDTRFYSTEISSLVSSMIIYLCAFVFFMKYILNKILQKRKEEKRIKEETSIRKLEDDKTSIKEEANNG
jgi:simple sugar transport system permease protein